MTGSGSTDPVHTASTSIDSQSGPEPNAAGNARTTRLGGSCWHGAAAGKGAASGIASRQTHTRTQRIGNDMGRSSAARRVSVQPGSVTVNVREHPSDAGYN